MKNNLHVTLTEKEIINLATPVREMTEEETDKFVTRLKYNEQFYEQCHNRLGVDTFEIRKTSGDQAHLYSRWWYNLLPLVEFTLKDLHMEDLLVKITGMYSYGYSNIDEITITLHNGKIYIVDSFHFNYPRQHSWMWPLRCGWTFGNECTQQVGTNCFPVNETAVSTYDDGTFLSRHHKWL